MFFGLAVDNLTDENLAKLQVNRMNGRVIAELEGGRLEIVEIRSK